MEITAAVRLLNRSEDKATFNPKRQNIISVLSQHFKFWFITSCGHPDTSLDTSQRWTVKFLSCVDVEAGAATGGTYRYKLIQLYTYRISAKLLVGEAGEADWRGTQRLIPVPPGFILHQYPPTVLAPLNRNPFQVFAFLCPCEGGWRGRQKEERSTFKQSRQRVTDILSQRC